MRPTTRPRRTTPASQEIPPLGSALEFLRLLWALDHGLHRSSKRMLRAVGVTGPQRLALRIIGRFPGITAGGLARIILLHPSTLSGVLARLESGGFVERRGDPGDGRLALFVLTEKGRAVDRHTAGTIEAAVESALARIPAASLAITREVLTTLAETLERGLRKGTAGSRPPAKRLRAG